MRLAPFHLAFLATDNFFCGFRLRKSCDNRHFLTSSSELSADGSAYSKAMTPSLTKPTTPPAQLQPLCHHTEVSYNVTLVGGINAGKFSTYGRTRTMGECIRHCCRDDKCDVSFMIQGNCYAVECVDTEGCQVKRAKPSSYNPTVAYVYRGNQRPIGGE